jgi:ASCH domain
MINVMNITHALIIREPWITLLLEGKKTWEMRSRLTKIRGFIGLIHAGSGLIVGVGRLVECLERLNDERMRQNIDFHRIPEKDLIAACSAGWTIPWVMEKIQAFKKPVPYTHPKGAVIWIKLTKNSRELISLQYEKQI